MHTPRILSSTEIEDIERRFTLAEGAFDSTKEQMKSISSSIPVLIEVSFCTIQDLIFTLKHHNT